MEKHDIREKLQMQDFQRVLENVTLRKNDKCRIFKEFWKITIFSKSHMKRALEEIREKREEREERGERREERTEKREYRREKREERSEKR